MLSKALVMFVYSHGFRIILPQTEMLRDAPSKINVVILRFPLATQIGLGGHGELLTIRRGRYREGELGTLGLDELSASEKVCFSGEKNSVCFFYDKKRSQLFQRACLEHMDRL